MERTMNFGGIPVRMMSLDNTDSPREQDKKNERQLEFLQKAITAAQNGGEKGIDEAFDLLSRGISIYPGSAAAGKILAFRSTLHEQRGNIEDAYKDSRTDARILRSDPSAAVSWVRTAQLAKSLGDATNYYLSAENALKLAPLDNKVQAIFVSSVKNLALDTCSKQPDTTQADWKGSADGILGRKEYSTAVVQYTTAIEKGSSPLCDAAAPLYTNRSSCWYNLSIFEEALADAELAIQIRPTWFRGYMRKAVAAMKLKKWEMSCAAFAKYFELDNDATVCADSELVRYYNFVKTKVKEEET